MKPLLCVGSPPLVREARFADLRSDLRAAVFGSVPWGSASRFHRPARALAARRLVTSFFLLQSGSLLQRTRQLGYRWILLHGDNNEVAVFRVCCGTVCVFSGAPRYGASFRRIIRTCPLLES